MKEASRVPVCFCGQRAGLHWGPFGAYWKCPAEGCDGRVGCHPGSTKPLGNIADAATRRARMHAHSTLDALWLRRPKRLRRTYRSAVYRWLAASLGIPSPHVGEMDKETALRVAGLCARTQPEDLEPFVLAHRADRKRSPMGSLMGPRIPRRGDK